MAGNIPGSPAGTLPPVDNSNSNLSGSPLNQATSVFYGSNQGNNQGGANAQSGMSSALNQYTGGQQALQNQLPGLFGSLLSGQGQIPPYWTAPPQVFQAYNDNFNRSVAPQIAAQYGAGSPQIGSQQSIGNEQLAAQLYQGGFNNYLNALNSGAGLAFNPVGQQSSNAGASNWQQQAKQNTLGYQSTSPLGSLGAGGAAMGSVLNQLVSALGF